MHPDGVFGGDLTSFSSAFSAPNPTPAFISPIIGKRLWDFFWEVLCQAKVIRERPLPGLAHAFVFWAFCAFALVTLNHCAAGLGLGFLSPGGIFGRFYFYLAALFALACAVCILGLFVRRFLVRPIWLGASSPGNPASSPC